MSCNVGVFFKAKLSFVKCKLMNIINVFIHERKVIYGHTNTCTHRYVHTYIRTYIHPYVHACIHTYKHTYIQT